jgi:hypothetical protein
MITRPMCAHGSNGERRNTDRWLPLIAGCTQTFWGYPSPCRFQGCLEICALDGLKLDNSFERNH